MKILVINICLRPTMPKKIFPMGISYIASAIQRAGFKFDFIDIDAYRYSDEELKEILKKKDFDIVVFGCIVTGYKIVKWLSSEIRKINKKAIIIAGNSVASSIPQIVLSKTEVDIAVFGEGDITIVELVRCLRNKKPRLEDVNGIAFKTKQGICYTDPRKVIENIDSIPHPEWDILPMDIYVEDSRNIVPKPHPIEKKKIRAMHVNTARGCIYKCTFCYQVFINNRYRFRSFQSVISEIKELVKRYSINYVFLWDDLTFFSKKRLAEFTSLLLKEKLDILWTGQCRGNLLNENDLLLAQDTKRSGCIALGYSIESANEGILKMMKKELDIKDIVIQKKLLDKAGIPTLSSVVVGYPIETEQTLKETFDFCYDNGIYPSTGFLLPQPGTPMYQYALQNGFIRDEEEYLMIMGDRQDLRINLTKIPDKKLQELVVGHLDRINKKLGLGLNKTSVIKTTVHQSKLKT